MDLSLLPAHWFGRVVLALVPVVASACKRAHEVKPDPTPASSKSASTPKAGVHYPRSSTGETLVATGPAVFMDMKGIRLGIDAPVLVPLEGDGAKGFAKDHKSSGSEADHDLRGLGDALEKLRKSSEGRELLLHVDARCTYRMVVELGQTAGRRGYSLLWFVVVDDKTDARRAIPLDLTKPASTLSKELELLAKKPPGTVPTHSPSIAPPPAPFVFDCSTTPMHLAVVVSANGIALKGFGRSIRAGCSADPTLPVMTFPNVGDAYDHAGLRACATTLHESPGCSTTSLVTVTLDANLTYQVLVSTWDAVRRTADDKPLLPELVMGVLR